MRKVYITSTVKMIVQVDEGTDIDEVLSAVEFSLPAASDASLEDASIDKFEITDSK